MINEHAISFIDDDKGMIIEMDEESRKEFKCKIMNFVVNIF